MNYQIASPETLEQHGIRKITHFDQSRVFLSPQTRLEEIRKSSEEFREYMLGMDKKVTFYQSIDLIRVPYPTKYGLLNVQTAKSKYLHILNRLFIVQFETYELSNSIT